MGTRGRSSAASLSVISSGGIETIRRPEPPEDLTEEQAAEWRQITNRLSADWFPKETHALLAGYCRHIIAARRVAEMIQSLEAMVTAEAAEEAADQKGAAVFKAVGALDKLLKMQERESRALASLATKMRISQQTTYDKSRKKPIQDKKPWES